MKERLLAVEAWENLFRAQHEIFAQTSGDFQEETLSQPEYDVMLNVSRGENATARLKDVTAHMLISQPSVSRLVDRMVSRGLVTKIADPADGRGYLLRGTAEGLRAFRRVGAAHARTIAERMAVLSDDELATLLHLTQKLRDAC